MSYYTRTFLVGAHWSGVPFPKLQTFSGRFWVPLIDYSLYKKMIIGIFYYLLMWEVTTKVNFCFYKQCSQAATYFICKWAIFPQNASIRRFWKWNLKCTSQSTQNLFSRKSNLKFYYIQFDFIHQCLGLSKDQTSNFKSLVIN